MSGILEAIRRREAAATEGPWVVEETEDGSCDGSAVYMDEGTVWSRVYICQDMHQGEEGEADAQFIAEARADIPRLLGALDAVLALHSKRVEQAVFGDCAAEACDHEDTCPTEPFAVCTACWEAQEKMDPYFMEGQISSVAYPCPTVTAVNDALEAS